MPCSMQCWTTPFSMLVSCQRLSSICTAEISVMRLRLLDLTHVHVAEADALDEPFVPERVQRTHARGQRRTRIRRVKLIQMNALHAERTQACFARGTQMASLSVRHPLAIRSSQAAFRRNDDARAVTAPACQRPRDEPLVVADVVIVQAIGVGGVEERDAAVECGVQELDRARLVAIGLSGQPHAPEPDRSSAGDFAADRAYSE